MPFTLAHPLAVVPLRRLSPRVAVLSALVIGSNAPDYAYFLPVHIRRVDSHSLAGLFWFCLPAGLLVYALFHLVLKRPLLELLPPALRVRLLSLPSARAGWPAAPLRAVLASLLLGALTHILWDSFTHVNGFAVMALPVLQAPALAIGPLALPLYKLLQYVSSAAGMLLLAAMVWAWLARTAPVPDLEGPPALRARMAVVAAIIAVASVVALARAAGALSAPITALAMQQAVGRAFVGWVAASASAALAYALVWHARRRRAARRAAPARTGRTRGQSGRPAC
ncbi:MAG: DUF4184 family protein [Deltaproteobacteria bacterium]|nr:DUF4184 family protein [Deltaproteobacteria bacterium]